jgi:hypothetical protein
VATYYVWGGGSNTAPYDTWAKAATTVTTVLGVPATSSDTILIASDNTNTAGAAITWSLPTSGPGLRIISTDRGTGAYTPGATVEVGAASAAFSINGYGSFYGLNIVGGTNNNTACDIAIGTASTSSHGLSFEDCNLTIASINSTAVILLCGTSSNTTFDEFECIFKNCVFKFNNAGQGFSARLGSFVFVGCSLDNTGSAPTNVFTIPGNSNSCAISCVGCDWSGVSWTNIATIAESVACASLSFWGCKFPSGWGTVTGAGASILGNYELFVSDCSSGDTHGFFGYYTPQGQAVLDTGIYYTSGAAAASWAITTTSLATPASPFMTPWIDLYNTGTSAITPYIEILRNNDSTSAWNDAQVWIEVAAKTNSGGTLASVTDDRASPTAAGAAQANGAGLGSWTGETGSCWSGKVGLASSITPAEVGHIRARVGVAINTSALYVDPQIRT